jgi:hypothetical protein
MTRYILNSSLCLKVTGSSCGSGSDQSSSADAFVCGGLAGVPCESRIRQIRTSGLSGGWRLTLADAPLQTRLWQDGFVRSPPCSIGEDYGPETSISTLSPASWFESRDNTPVAEGFRYRNIDESRGIQHLGQFIA